jgi:uncharacterized protein with PQ loop repeat
MGQGDLLINPERIMLTSALGCLGAVLSMSLAWPQVWRSCVHRRTTGLSATACWLGVALPIGWITYGLLIGDRLQVVTNSVTGGAGVAILVALLMAQLDLRTGKKLLISTSSAAGVVAAAAFSAVATALPEFDGAEVAPMLGAVLSVTSILAAIPQPLSLLRDRTQDLSGLSPLRWRLAAGAYASWFCYGVATGQAAVWLSSSVALISALIVCTLLALRNAAVAAPIPAGVPAARGVARVLPATDFPTMVIPAGWLASRELVGAAA